LINKDSLHRLLNDSDQPSAKLLSFTIQGLIILSLVTFSISTLPELSPVTIKILSIIETVTVIVFSLEYVLRIYAAEQKLRFIFSFYGLVDLVAILPYYLTTGLDLRAVRVFRLLRLMRILKLYKYNAALNRFHHALRMVREELIIFGFISTILLFLSAIGIYYFEHAAQPDKFKSVFHALWWSLTTLTTVGYGDIYPITAGGKIFTFFVLIIGLGVIAVPTGLVASALTHTSKEDINS
jgi:voltage-gated potassium channel